MDAFNGAEQKLNSFIPRLSDVSEGTIDPDPLNIPPNHFATLVGYIPLRQLPHHPEAYRFNVYDHDYNLRETWMTVPEVQNHRGW